MLCAAQEIVLCAQDGNTSTIPITEIFQQINGPIGVTNVGGNFTFFDLPNNGQRFFISSDGTSISWIQDGVPNGQSDTVIICSSDNDGELCCEVTFTINDCSGGGGGNNTNGCTNVGPITLPINSQSTLQPNEIHSSGLVPGVVSESDFTRTSIIGLSPVTVTGIAVGQNTVTYVFGGEECTVVYNVVDENGNGGGGNNTGDCLNYNPPVIQVGGGTLQIPYASIHASGLQPAIVGEDDPNNAILITGENPTINIQGQNAGNATVTFEFPNGDRCEVSFTVVDESTGENCSFSTCSDLTYSVTGINANAEQAQGSSTTIGCGATHSLSIFVPNPNQEAIAPTINIGSTVLSVTLAGQNYDATTQRTILEYTLSANSQGCGSLVPITVDFSGAGSSENIQDCGSCLVANILVSDCPDCATGGGNGGQNGECSKEVIWNKSVDVIQASTGETLFLGPFEGCNCSGCVRRVVNHQDNPVDIPIVNPFSPIVQINIPASVPSGDYQFIPVCCDCDE